MEWREVGVDNVLAFLPGKGEIAAAEEFGIGDGEHQVGAVEAAEPVWQGRAQQPRGADAEKEGHPGPV